MRRRRSRLRLAALWCAFVIVAGVLVNVYMATRPAMLEARLRAELGKVLAGPFEFSAVTLSLRRGIEVRDLRVFSPALEGPASGSPSGAGGDEVFSARSVRVIPRLLALARGSLAIADVLVESPRMALSRSAEGRWNFQGLISPDVWGEPGAAAEAPALPGLLLTNGRVVFEDAYSFREPVSEAVEDVYARLVPRKDGTVMLNAQLRVPFARKLELSGSLSFSGGQPVVRAHVIARKIDLSTPCEKYLPGEVAEQVKRLGLRGFVDLDGIFRFDYAGGLVPIQVAGKVLRCELTLPYAPFPVRGLQGDFTISERTFEIRSLEGSFGTGRVILSSKADFAGPWLFVGKQSTPAWWTFNCGVDSFVFDERVRAALPPDVRKVLNTFRFDGEVGVNIRVPGSSNLPPLPEDISATIHLQGVSFVCRQFPYMLENLQGDMLVEKGRISFERPIEGRDGPLQVSVTGRGVELRRGGEVDVVVKATSVPIDENLRAAMPVEALGIWDDFQLLGSGDAVIRVTREAVPGGADADADPDARVAVTVFPQGARMSYRHFPYEIRGITGKIHVDTGAKRLTFDDLKGKHGQHEIAGHGVVDFEATHEAKNGAAAGRGPLLSIRITSESVDVDQDLVAALSEESRQIINDFDFKGRVKVDVHIQSTERSTAEVEADVDLIQGSLRPRMVPYPLELVGGRLEIAGSQSLKFAGFTTAPTSKPQIRFDGSLSTKGDERSLWFVLDLSDLHFDDKLVAALPPPLPDFINNIKLGGKYRGRVRGNYAFSLSDSSKYSITYQGEDISAEEASVDFGLYIHDMVARGSFLGGRESGRPHSLVGEVQVESGWFNRLHLTKGDIDFVLGVAHPAIKLAREGRRIEGREYVPPSFLVERLAEEKVKDTFQMLVHSPDLYGGVVEGFLYVDTGAIRDVGGDFMGKRIDLAKAAGDVFGAKSTESKGMARGKFRFQGKAGDVYSIEGKGEGAIDQARLVELPLFLGMLSLLFGENSRRHYFNEVLLKYDIGGGKFKAPAKDGIEIRSPGVKLSGGGTMDFDGNLDLRLEPRVLDFKIPLLDDIFSWVKRGLAQVWIEGDLKSPRVRFVTGAGILRIGIQSGTEGAKDVPLPSDVQGSREEKTPKDLPPGSK